MEVTALYCSYTTGLSWKHVASVDTEEEALMCSLDNPEDCVACGS